MVFNRNRHITQWALIWSVLVFVAIDTSTSSAYASLVPLKEYLVRSSQPKKQLKLTIQMEMNPSIQYWINQFKGPQKTVFREFLSRGSLYQTQIESILTRTGAPPELFYLAMIESGFVTSATSPVQAVGIWQFIQSTGKRYGLKQDSMIDERRDVIRSSYAASRYLVDLYREFHSWYLAMAAYNAGVARVLWAVREGKTKDYWTLAEKGLFPVETLQYIPKFQAAMRIARDPKRYGFDSYPLLEYPNLKKFKVTRAIALFELAQRLRIPVNALRVFNPHIIQGVIPKYDGGYEVWIPDLTRVNQKTTKSNILTQGKLVFLE